MPASRSDIATRVSRHSISSQVGRALGCCSDPFLTSTCTANHRLALRRVSASGDLSVAANTCEAGGLMSYGPALPASYRQAGDLRRSNTQRRETGRSAGPAAHQFELVINLKTAKALGITVPPSLLAQPTRSSNMSRLLRCRVFLLARNRNAAPETAVGAFGA